MGCHHPNLDIGVIEQRQQCAALVAFPAPQLVLDSLHLAKGDYIFSCRQHKRPRIAQKTDRQEARHQFLYVGDLISRLIVI